MRKVCEVAANEDCDMIALKEMKVELESKLGGLQKGASKTEEKKAVWGRTWSHLSTMRAFLHACARVSAC
eukprot:4350581-Lingulodinium_polyedra.AAC.1